MNKTYQVHYLAYFDFYRVHELKKMNYPTYKRVYNMNIKSRNKQKKKKNNTKLDQNSEDRSQGGWHLH